MNELRMLGNKKILTLLLTKESAEHDEHLNTYLEFLLFLLRYSFLLTDIPSDNNFSKRQFPPPGGLFSQNSNGGRYLDAKYSRWISTDPALGEYVPAAGKSNEADKLPGMGGIFNSVNLSLYHYAGNNPVKYLDPDGNEIDKPSWILVPDKCKSYSYTTYNISPRSGCPSSITTSRNVEHSRISFSVNFNDHQISFSGTKDVITNEVSGGAGGSKDIITLIRLNVNYDEKNYDYYSLKVENTTRVLLIPFPNTYVTTQLIEDFVNDPQSLYNGEFNRDKIEEGVAINSILNLATAGFLGLVNTPDSLSQNLLNAATEKLKGYLMIKHNSYGSDDIKRDIEYILPKD